MSVCSPLCNALPHAVSFAVDGNLQVGQTLLVVLREDLKNPLCRHAIKQGSITLRAAPSESNYASYPTNGSMALFGAASEWHGERFRRTFRLDRATFDEVARRLEPRLRPPRPGRLGGHPYALFATRMLAICLERLANLANTARRPTWRGRAPWDTYRDSGASERFAGASFRA